MTWLRLPLLVEERVGVRRDPDLLPFKGEGTEGLGCCQRNAETGHDCKL
jgi:hypothetical protein